MKSTWVGVFIALTIIQCSYYVSAKADLKCYDCLYHNVTAFSGVRKPNDPSCRIDKTPPESLLKTCENHGEHDSNTCGLFHITGKNQNDDKFEITLRDCLPKQKLKLKCHKIKVSEFEDLEGVDQAVKDLLRNAEDHKTDVQACSCDKTACNKNDHTAKAGLTTVGNMGNVGFLALFAIIASMLM